MDAIKIIILDSGVRKIHPAFKEEPKGYGLKYDKERDIVIREEDFEDSIGHGTALYEIVSKNSINSDILNIKILYGLDLEIDDISMIKILNYIDENESFNIINISLGITASLYLDKLEKICDKISLKGVIIAAFDNLGAISYPAAFESVIGVDSSKIYKKKFDYEFIESKKVNIRAKGTLQRLAWTKPDYVIMLGSSFACGFITARVTHFIQSDVTLNVVLKILREHASIVINNDSIIKDKSKSRLLDIKNAALFPINKEMHALLANPDLLTFEIDGIYDISVSGKVGLKVKDIISYGNPINRTIENIEHINWFRIDSLILGHLEDLKQFTDLERLISELLQKAKKYDINIYSFEEIQNESAGKINYFWPQITINDLPKFNFGKVFKIASPVLFIGGTKSKIGKMTLQLELRRRFLKNGYNIGQLGTEPNSFLFGMDDICVTGYNSHIEVNNWELFQIVNYKLHMIDKNRKPDIILVGGQSGLLPLVTDNISYYPFIHQIFYQAVQADAIILCVAPDDDIEFVKRTIAYAESTGDCQVIALCCYPLELEKNWRGYCGKKANITEKEYFSIKLAYNSEIGIPMYFMGDEEQLNELFDLVISTFS